jgi:hypothetical protein
MSALSIGLASSSLLLLLLLMLLLLLLSLLLLLLSLSADAAADATVAASVRTRALRPVPDCSGCPSPFGSRQHLPLGPVRLCGLRINHYKFADLRTGPPKKFTDLGLRNELKVDLRFAD